MSFRAHRNDRIDRRGAQHRHDAGECADHQQHETPDPERQWIESRDTIEQVLEDTCRSRGRHDTEYDATRRDAESVAEDQTRNARTGRAKCDAYSDLPGSLRDR